MLDMLQAVVAIQLLAVSVSGFCKHALTIYQAHGLSVKLPLYIHLCIPADVGSSLLRSQVFHHRFGIMHLLHRQTSRATCNCTLSVSVLAITLLGR